MPEYPVHISWQGYFEYVSKGSRPHRDIIILTEMNIEYVKNIKIFVLLSQEYCNSIHIV